MSGVLVSATGITHTFGKGPAAFTALHDVALTVRAGELLLLMGPSGSGKTTLLHVLGCLLRPTQGQVQVLGQDTAGLRDAALGRLRLKHFGFVFQAHNLFPMLTAAENVMVALDLAGQRGSAARRRAEDLLGVVGLSTHCNAYPATLSGGQRQRVAIARALAADPVVLMADEPTAALDSDNGHRVMDLFRALAADQRRGVVIVTHDPRIVPLAGRIVRLDDGRVVPEPARMETA